MKPVFVDTSALIAMGNKRDYFHLQSIKIRNELQQSQSHFVTTNAVLLEFGNAFSAVHLRPVAIKMIEAINHSPKWHCVSIDDVLINQGFQQFKQVTDKAWGFVDCISIIVAKKRGITEVFTADHHFEQAGFRMLLQK